MNKKLSILTTALVCTFIISSSMKIDTDTRQQKGNWVAPASADNTKNPLKGNTASIAEGKKVYKRLCAICHGDKGKGDGVAGMSLNPKPANFQTDLFAKQSDGAIHWKLDEGRAPMASYKDILTEDEKWQVINYLRSLK